MVDHVFGCAQWELHRTPIYLANAIETNMSLPGRERTGQGHLVIVTKAEMADTLHDLKRNRKILPDTYIESNRTGAMDAICM